MTDKKYYTYVNPALANLYDEKSRSRTVFQIFCAPDKDVTHCQIENRAAADAIIAMIEDDERFAPKGGTGKVHLFPMTSGKLHERMVNLAFTIDDDYADQWAEIVNEMREIVANSEIFESPELTK